MKNQNKKIGFFIAILIPAVAAVGILLFTSANRSEKENVSVPNEEVVNELEENGAAGTRLNDQEQIKEALVEKNDWNLEDIEVSIIENDGIYAKGMVGSVGGGPGGGIWFAVNEVGTWEIVWDGNGIIMCEDLVEYPDFPSDMIPECYNSSTDEMITR